MKKLTIIAAIFTIILTANVFAQPTWTLQTSPVTTDLNSCWAVNNDIAWMCGPSGVVIKTTNGGSTWALANTGLTGNDFYTIYAFDATNCWVGAGDGGLWHTINGGANWSFVTLSPASVFINVVHFFDANFGFIQGDPVASQWRYYTTTNGGANWFLPSNTPTSVGTEAGWNNSYGALDTGHIWWGTNASKIWKGSLLGAFTSAPTTGSPNSFGVWFNNANTGVACFQTGANKTSINGGSTWNTNAFSPIGTPFGLRGVPGTQYIWMSTASRIFRSVDNGSSFTSQFTLPAGQSGYCIGMANINCGWVGTATGKIYKYTDNVGIGNPITTPTKFELKQNYPNPFNPQTTIDFSLARTGYITLKIYNLMGQEVMTLIDGVETAGDHSVFFDASGLSSGTYFYAMKSGDFTETKSMVLVK